MYGYGDACIGTWIYSYIPCMRCFYSVLPCVWARVSDYACACACVYMCVCSYSRELAEGMSVPLTVEF